MKETVVITRRKGDPFARIDKKMLEDAALSGLAKWILCYLLSKPPGWKLVPRDIANHCKDGISAIRARLAELREAGYARLDPIRDAGKLIEWQWQISDSPIFKPGNSPDVVIPHLENQHLSKNDRYNAGNIEPEPIHSSWCDCATCGNREVIPSRR